MVEVVLGGKNLSRKCFIIFECGATFVDIRGAKKLIDVAAEAGADSIKFQILDVDELVGDKTLTIPYQTHQGQKIGNLYDILKKRELPLSAWKELKHYCDAKGILFFATAMSHKALDLLKNIGACAIKIAAGDCDNYSLIEYAAQSKLPMISLLRMLCYHNIEVLS